MNTLRLRSLVSENGDEGESLENIYRTITKLYPQVPTSHRGDAHKRKFFRNSVVGCKWEIEQLSRIVTHGLAFEKLYGELEAAYQL